MAIKRASILVVAIPIIVIGAGCATPGEWQIWRQHPAHFASADHLQFSVRNRAGSVPIVRRHDMVNASAEGWWGEPITVAQEAILER